MTYDQKTNPVVVAESMVDLENLAADVSKRFSHSDLNPRPVNYAIETLAYQCANVSCSKPSAKRCGKCKSVYYCSVECQKLHWNSEHKSQCVERKLASELVVQNRIMWVLGHIKANDLDTRMRDFDRKHPSQSKDRYFQAERANSCNTIHSLLLTVIHTALSQKQKTLQLRGSQVNRVQMGVVVLKVPDKMNPFYQDAQEAVPLLETDTNGTTHHAVVVVQTTDQKEYVIDLSLSQYGIPAYAANGYPCSVILLPPLKHTKSYDYKDFVPTPLKPYVVTKGSMIQTPEESLMLLSDTLKLEAQAWKDCSQCASSSRFSQKQLREMMTAYYKQNRQFLLDLFERVMQSWFA